MAWSASVHAAAASGSSWTILEKGLPGPASPLVRTGNQPATGLGRRAMLLHSKAAPQRETAESKSVSGESGPVGAFGSGSGRVHPGARGTLGWWRSGQEQRRYADAGSDRSARCVARVAIHVGGTGSGQRMQLGRAFRRGRLGFAVPTGPMLVRVVAKMRCLG